MCTKSVLGEKIMDLNLDTIVMVRFKFTIEDVLDMSFSV